MLESAANSGDVPTPAHFTTQNVDKVLQKCHETFLKSLTLENVDELTTFLYAQGIFTRSEREAIDETDNLRKANKMLSTLEKKYESIKTIQQLAKYILVTILINIFAGPRITN